MVEEGRMVKEGRVAELKKVQGRSPNQKCRFTMFPKVRKSRQTIKASKQRNFHI